MRWCVDVGYPLEEAVIGDNGLFERDDQLREIAAKYDGEDAASGGGFGVRDIQFYTNRKLKAVMMAHDFSELLGPGHPDPYGTDTEIPYVSVYREPKNILIYLLHTREYKEFWNELWKTVTGANRRSRKQWYKDHPSFQTEKIIVQDDPDE